jgi:hypothetical protein
VAGVPSERRSLITIDYWLRVVPLSIYAGKVEHRGATYTGEQPSIVEPSPLPTRSPQ